MALSYITGTVTQGGADAFAQAEVATALSGVTGRAFQVRTIEIELASGSLANGAISEVTLTRRTKTAIPLITDRDVIVKAKFLSLLTTSGAIRQDLVSRWSYSEDDELLIVEDPLYLQIDGTSTSGTYSAYVRIGYTSVSISQVDRLTLLTQSLAD